MSKFSFEFNGVTFTAGEKTEDIKSETATYLQSEVSDITDNEGNPYDPGYNFTVTLIKPKDSDTITSDFFISKLSPDMNRAIIQGLIIYLSSK